MLDYFYLTVYHLLKEWIISIVLTIYSYILGKNAKYTYTHSNIYTHTCTHIHDILHNLI